MDKNEMIMLLQYQVVDKLPHLHEVCEHFRW